MEYNLSSYLSLISIKYKTDQGKQSQNTEVIEKNIF